MKKLYCVRLFRLLMDPTVSSKYQVYTVGSIIVSKKKKNCKEFLYGVDIPVVDIEIDANNNAYLSPEESEIGYVILKDDFTERNRLTTTKDLMKFNFDSYAEISMRLVKFEKETHKNYLKRKME